MTGDSKREFSLAELAEAAGVSPRTVRFYISRGLLPGPLRRGRNAAYGPRHLELLRRIRQLRDDGLGLRQIRYLLAREDASAPEPPGEPSRGGTGREPLTERRDSLGLWLPRDLVPPWEGAVPEGRAERSDRSSAVDGPRSTAEAGPGEGGQPGPWWPFQAESQVVRLEPGEEGAAGRSFRAGPGDEQVPGEDPGPAPDEEPVPWWRFEVAPDVVVEVRADITPWRLHRIRRALAEMASSLAGSDGDDPAP